MFDNLKKIFSSADSVSEEETNVEVLQEEPGTPEAISELESEVPEDTEPTGPTAEPTAEPKVEPKGAPASEELPLAEEPEESQVTEEEVAESEAPEENPHAELLSIVGDLSAEDLKTLIERGRNYEDAVKAARAEGKKAGRCEQIEEYIDKGAADSTDGIPRLASTPLSSPRRLNTIFDLAREA